MGTLTQHDLTDPQPGLKLNEPYYFSIHCFFFTLGGPDEYSLISWLTRHDVTVRN